MINDVTYCNTIYPYTIRIVIIDVNCLIHCQNYLQDIEMKAREFIDKTLL